MASVQPILHLKKSKQGLYPIVIRITHNRWAGTIYNSGTLLYDGLAGEEITASRIADSLIGVGLSAIAISNPIGWIALGVYALADSHGAFDGIKESLGGNTVIFNGN